MFARSCLCGSLISLIKFETFIAVKLIQQLADNLNFERFSFFYTLHVYLQQLADNSIFEGSTFLYTLNSVYKNIKPFEI